MTERIDTSINLALPSVPEGIDDPILFQTILQIYNAIRSLAIGVDEYTQEGDLAFEAQIGSAILFAQVVALKNKVNFLEQQLAGALTNVMWAQPGPIGDNAPNSVAATTLSASDVSTLADTTVGKFGANGQIARAARQLPVDGTDLATTMALVNQMKVLLIECGLGRN